MSSPLTVPVWGCCVCARVLQQPAAEGGARRARHYTLPERSARSSLPCLRSLERQVSGGDTVTAGDGDVAGTLGARLLGSERATARQDDILSSCLSLLLLLEFSEGSSTAGCGGLLPVWQQGLCTHAARVTAALSAGQTSLGEQAEF